MALSRGGKWEILNVLRRLEFGESKSSIAVATGRSRSTIRRISGGGLGVLLMGDNYSAEFAGQIICPAKTSKSVK